MSIYKKLVKIISICLSIILFVSCFGIKGSAATLENDSDIVAKKTLQVDEKIPNEVTRYVLDKYLEIIEIAKSYYTEFSDDTEDYSLGVPFVIYSEINKNWNSVYYYPVIKGDCILLVISVIDTNYGLTLSASKEFVPQLNEINYITDSNWIFYEDNNRIIALSEKSTILMSEDSNTTFSVKSDEQKSYTDLLNTISKKIEQRSPIDVDYITNLSKNIDFLEEYTPSFSTNTSTSQICQLYNAQGQIGGTCWAASVATIVNYRLGTGYTAYDVCDKIGVDYAAGTIGDKLYALSSYGLNYSRSDSQAPWNTIKNNIAGQYPIAASTFSGSDGHAITVYGYRTIGATDYIVFWNSGEQSTQIVTYLPNGTTYSYNGTTWTWTKSLYYLP